MTTDAHAIVVHSVATIAVVDAASVASAWVHSKPLEKVALDRGDRDSSGHQTKVHRSRMVP